ncbi:putative C16C4.16c-like protein [Cladobotryum mycophilum]|uniref:C16C4.16c-like protein n=1 Tax=Cladobotryum mycophilum TaxID=491253 RepID=A0ABR0SUP7_9HYPO
MDLDIEMGDSAEGLQEIHDHELPQNEDILQPDEPEEPGEVADDEPKNNDDDDASKTIIPTKIHIRGVDTLHTNDIKAYVKAHYGDVDKVEWIDDTSANLVFGSESITRDAIVALSSIEIADATALAAGESLPAKSIEGRPEISLHVRFAVEADKKQVGAALRSRYYLLHPEHDPEERRRRQQEGRSKYRERDRDHDYRRNGARRRTESDDEVETFEASMYDDAPRKSRDRRSSESDDRLSRSHVRENKGKELFADRPVGRDRAMRNRSASPRRNRDMDNDGDANMDEGASSSRNKERRGQLDQLEKAIGSAHLQEEDMPKIVAIPDAAVGDSLNIRGMASQRAGGDNGFSIKGAASAKELFPDRFGAGNVGKELISKRRQRAEDLFS